MKSVCLVFQIHQPFRLRRFRFFDIGHDDYYYDDYANETVIRKLAVNSYLPANDLLLRQIKRHNGRLKVSFYISGIAIEQLSLYAPEVIESFKKLAQTGCAEFLPGTYSHSLSSLQNRKVFEDQCLRHKNKIEELFGNTSTVFQNTELIYSDEIGDSIAVMGYQGVLTEGAKHILGWKSPNFVYYNAINPRMKVLMRHFKLSDDLTFHFSNPDWVEYPLTAEKYKGWIEKLDDKDEVVNLLLEYETFGSIQPRSTGIFTFLDNLIDLIVPDSNIEFSTPGEVIRKLQPVSLVSVPHPISWAGEERDISAWQGNELQAEALRKLYEHAGRMKKCTDQRLCRDWNYLQATDHFYFMTTINFLYQHHFRANPFNSPYEAFINYMNVLSDFNMRLNNAIPEFSAEELLAELTQKLEEKEIMLRHLEHEISLLEKRKKSKPGKN